ncbi:hypothetical protein ACU4GD_45755 [Cupriavidus basilensis]
MPGNRECLAIIILLDHSVKLGDQITVDKYTEKVVSQFARATQWSAVAHGRNPGALTSNWWRRP